MKRKMTLVQVHICMVVVWTIVTVGTCVNLLASDSDPNSIGNLVALFLVAIALLLFIVTAVVKSEPQDERSRENMRKATNKSHFLALTFLTMTLVCLVVFKSKMTLGYQWIMFVFAILCGSESAFFIYYEKNERVVC